MRRYAASIGISVLMLVVLHTAGAQKVDVTDDLLVVNGFVEQIRDARARCFQSAISTDVEAQYRLNPEIFGGLSPASSLWPEARENYLSYLSSMCDMVTLDEMIDIAKEVYGDGLSHRDVDAILEFYGTGSGRRYAKASTSITLRLNELVYSGKYQDMEEAWRSYMVRLQELLGEAEKKSSVPLSVEPNDARP